MNKIMKDYWKGVSLQKKASFAYMFASIMSKGLNYLTLPIFTRILTVDDMGKVTTFNTWYTILYVVVTLSLTSGSINIAMMEYSDKRDKYQAVCLSLSTFSAVVFSIIYIIYWKWINNFTTLSTSLMIMQIALFFFNPALDSWYARQRYEYKYKLVVGISIISTVLSVVVAIVILNVAKKYGVENLGEIRIISQNSIIAIFGFGFFIKILKNGKCIFDKKMAVFALKTSVPLIIHSLAKNILDASDRLMINKYCGSEKAGIYGTVYSISLAALIVWSAINSSIIPYLFDRLREKDFITVDKVAEKVLILFGCVSSIITLIAPEILKILTTTDYYEAVYIIPAITAGVYMTALYGIYGNLLLYMKKTSQIMIATVIATLANLCMNYVGIKVYGYMAAAYTTLISFIILAFLQGVMCLKVYKRNVLNVKKIVMTTSCFICICLTCVRFYDYFIIRYILLSALIVICGIFLKKYMRKSNV